MKSFLLCVSLSNNSNKKKIKKKIFKENKEDVFIETMDHDEYNRSTEIIFNDDNNLSFTFLLHEMLDLLSKSFIFLFFCGSFKY